MISIFKQMMKMGTSRIKKADQKIGLPFQVIGE